MLRKMKTNDFQDRFNETMFEIANQVKENANTINFNDILNTIDLILHHNN